MLYHSIQMRKTNINEFSVGPCHQTSRTAFEKRINADFLYNLRSLWSQGYSVFSLINPPKQKYILGQLSEWYYLCSKERPLKRSNDIKLRVKLFQTLTTPCTECMSYVVAFHFRMLQWPTTANTQKHPWFHVWNELLSWFLNREASNPAWSLSQGSTVALSTAKLLRRHVCHLHILLSYRTTSN